MFAAYSSFQRANADASSQAGLVGWWKFDEGSGTIAHDSSGNGNNGTVYGATWTTGQTGQTGSALQFDGVDDYVAIPDLYASSPSALTVAAWIKSPLLGGQQSIIHHSQNGEFTVETDSYGEITFGVKLTEGGGTWYDVRSTTTTNAWHFIAGTWTEGGALELYVDGQLVNQTSVTDYYLFDAYWLNSSIGCMLWPSGPALFFNGTIDDVMVYTRALSAAEISNEYQASSVNSWPMFHHDLNHSGYSTSTAPKTNQTLWSYTTGNAVDSSPAVYGDVVYVGSQDDKVYALNATTSKQVWSYTTGGLVQSSPAVSGGVVYVGSRDDNVYALNAATGAVAWSYTTGGWVASSPVVAGGLVYVGSFDDKVYALNAATGAVAWSYTTGNAVDSCPAVSGGVVFVGSDDHNVYALNASTGQKIWNYTTGSLVRSSPAVAGGVVYVGSRDDNVYALNASTGALVWSYTTGNAVDSCPAVANGVVFVGSYDDKVYALNASTGALKWSYTTGNFVWSAPAVAGGVVYVGSLDDKVYALNAATGALVWSYTAAGAVGSSPAVVGGVVYVGSYDDKVYAFGVHDVAVTGLTSYHTIQGQGYADNISVTVGNYGSYDETFKVTVYANTTIIGSQNDATYWGASGTVNIRSNTAGFLYGNYTISANVTLASGETNSWRGPFTYGTVEVTIPGDVDGNHQVNILDVVHITSIYGSKLGSPKFNPNCDIDGDGKITILDVVACTSHYGQKWS